MRVTLKDLKKLYSRFRRLYYAGGSLPPVRDLIIRYTIFKDSSMLALTSRVEKAGKILWIVEFHESLRKQPRLHAVMLLHEMSHIYKWRLNHGPGWDLEALRLGSLGAMKEFF